MGLYFECPYGSAINRLYSIHDNHHEDRRWGFDCKDVKEWTYSECHWSGYVNDYDEYLFYNCPQEGALITGMESVHNNHHEDRRWNYKCCNVAKTSTHGCYHSMHINNMDGPMDYKVQDGYWISGLESEHDSHHEDRVWRLELCKIQKDY